VRALAASALVALGLAAPASHARDLYREAGASLELSGSLRERGVVTRGTDADAFARSLTPACLPVAAFPDCPAWDRVGERDVWTSLSRLRLRLDARANEHLSAVVVYDNEGLVGILDTLESDLAEGLSSEGFVDLEGVIVEREHAEWRHLLYRGYLLFESKRLELTAGRQRIPWGVGRLWNPIDRFNAVGPLAIEPDQSPGVDALKARWLFDGFTFLEAIYAAGHRSEDRMVAGRAQAVIRDVDVGVVGGVFAEAPTLGFDLASNLGDAAGRLEVVWTDPKRRVRPFGETRKRALADYWQVVVSVDTNLDWGSGLYLLVEHLYNGNALGFGSGAAGGLLGFFQEAGQGAARIAAPGTPDLFGQSQVVTLGEQLTGVQLSYDPTPELTASLLVLVGWERTSASFFPSLRYSPLDWLELTAGVQLFAGPERSEFGDRDPLGYLLAEVFF
jgi:hypothetical protein